MPLPLAMTAPPLWVTGALAALVVSAAIVDLKTGRVSNWLTHGGIVVGLAVHWITGGLTGGDDELGLVGSLTGLGIGFAPLGLFWLANAIGGGDAKLMGAIGALGGWRLALAALVYGMVVAALMAVIVMVHQRVVRQTLRRVWHTLGLLVLKGRPADPTSPDSPTVPFAVALCVGTAGAALESYAGFGLGRLVLGG